MWDYFGSMDYFQEQLAKKGIVDHPEIIIGRKAVEQNV